MPFGLILKLESNVVTNQIFRGAERKASAGAASAARTDGATATMDNKLTRTKPNGALKNLGRNFVVVTSETMSSCREKIKKPAVGTNKGSSASFKNGRPSARVLEPAGLTVSRTYEVAWKKKILDFAELAKLRFEDGLGSRVIAQRIGANRSTVIDAIHHLERHRELR